MNYTSLIKEVNIPELVKALRNCAEPGTIIDECDTADDCPYSLDGYCGDCMNNIVKDAAAAIEALQAQLPKQGEWLIHSIGGSMATKKCPFCGSESWQSKEYAKVPKYCQNCGAHLPTFNIVDWVDYLYAKMEAQDDKA